MEPNDIESVVYNIQVSSVVPGRLMGENKTYELTPMDLAMKLHYLKGLYFFSNRIGTISITELKKPMFDLLVPYFMVCGRVRVDKSDAGGRPDIKLNDAGIRIIEAQSSKTVEEWLAMDSFLSHQDKLVCGHPLGPELEFSPLIFVQITWFKCGGISVGLRWAHILGDVFSASAFMNMFGKYFEGHYHNAQKITFPDKLKPKYLQSELFKKSLSIKRVNLVGDQWISPTKCNMVTYSLSISSAQLDMLLLKVNEKRSKSFELISAIVWKSIAKIRVNLEPKVITACKPKIVNGEQVGPHNGLTFGTCEANSLVSTSHLPELISMISTNIVDDRTLFQELAEENDDKLDCIIYGANLTFVDMNDANIYGFELKGESPTFACYSIDGVGEEGVVLILPGALPMGTNGIGRKNVGKLVVITIREDELPQLKAELEKEWCMT